MTYGYVRVRTPSPVKPARTAKDVMKGAKSQRHKKRPITLPDMRLMSTIDDRKADQFAREVERDAQVILDKDRGNK